MSRGRCRARSTSWPPGARCKFGVKCCCRSALRCWCRPGTAFARGSSSRCRAIRMPSPNAGTGSPANLPSREVEGGRQHRMPTRHARWPRGNHRCGPRRGVCRRRCTDCRCLVDGVQDRDDAITRFVLVAQAGASPAVYGSGPHHAGRFRGRGPSGGPAGDADRVRRAGSQPDPAGVASLPVRASAVTASPSTARVTSRSNGSAMC